MVTAQSDSITFSHSVIKIVSFLVIEHSFIHEKVFNCIFNWLKTFLSLFLSLRDRLDRQPVLKRPVQSGQRAQSALSHAFPLSSMHLPLLYRDMQERKIKQTLRPKNSYVAAIGKLLPLPVGHHHYSSLRHLVQRDGKRMRQCSW